MQNKYKAVEQLEFVQTLKMLAQSYEEVSVIKMQRVKSSVLANREFLTELSNVFLDVKASYRSEIDTLMKKTQESHHVLPFRRTTMTTLNKNGKTVSILLSPQGKLYGDVIKKVFHLFTFRIFVENSRKESTDIVIIGKSGKELFDGQEQKQAYTYFDLPDEHVTINDLKPIITYILNYEKIHVYYGKFINMVSQEAVATDISGGGPLEQAQEGFEHKIRYFFEPSLAKILQFFESQVFTSFFQQTIHESELARLASRTRAMEEALLNIEHSEGVLKMQGKRLKKMYENKKQLEALSGMSMWKGR